MSDADRGGVPLLPEEQPLLPAVLGNRYQTGPQVGRGGMALVYKARDLKHGRDVAIKVVRAEHAQSLGRDRFLREMAIAARLRHPNILPLYDSGDADGALYFVMPFEAGLSLRDRLLQGGALPVAEAIPVLRDVARALQYAHGQQVAHRDIKPDNVLMSGGAAVVADFGIAKAYNAALTTIAARTITQTGVGIGTPAYMAPEQATGDPSTDHRADIYSFGCLAYELFTGQPPFHGLSTHQVIAAHMTVAPRPLGEAQPAVPAAIAQVIDRCLAKDPDARPESMALVLDALEQPFANTMTATARRRPVVLAAVVAMAAVGGLLWSTRSAPAPKASLAFAVVPFVNTAADTSIDYLTEAIPDELASALTRVPGILIRSRSGARHYRGQLTVDVTEAGARLNAEYILTGLLRRERGSWIVKAEVARAADKTMIWEERFTLDPSQQAGAIATITRSLVDTLRVRFPEVVGATPVIAPAGTQLANDFYLGGQAALRRRQQSVRQAVDQFRRAIHEDSSFAPAWAGLSMALALVPHFEPVPAAQVFDSVVHAASKALALDPTLSTPHVARGLAYQLSYDWTQAEREYQAAIRLDSTDVEARVQYGRHLMFRGRHAEAMRTFRIARQLDPGSPIVLSWLAHQHFLDGRLDSALAESRRALGADPDNYTTVMLGALLRLRTGDLAEARELVRRAPRRSPLNGYVLARAGDTTAAQAFDRMISQDTPRRWMTESALAYTALGRGDTARALAGFERATDLREIWPSLYSAVTDPVYASIRDTKRFQALMRRVNLPMR